MPNDNRPPRDVTVVRVLLLLTGFTSAVNGLLEQNPTYATSTRVFGWFLVAFGVACWWLTFRLRRPAPRLRTEVTVLLVLLVAIRIYQVVRFHTPAPAVGLILPALVYWRMRRRPVRGWLSGQERTDGRRRFAALGAVGITVAALTVVTGAGAALAFWPCSLPTAASRGLSYTQTDSGASPRITPSGRINATDGVSLAYYSFVPTDPVASLVFYHGSGANSYAGYLPLARELAQRYRIATYLFDMRGHGQSGGPRGDTPTPDQVWQDTATAVSYVHNRKPSSPLYVGGHSSGAGVVLNSMNLIDKDVAGYVFLAPDFGLHSDTEKVADGGNFATICQRPFVVNALSNHVLDGHTEALGFAYTAQQVQQSDLIPRYTVNMSLAQNADDSAAVLKGMDKPMGMWVGAQDEVFDAAKLRAYADQAGNLGQDTVRIVPKDNHLGILTDGASYVGPWIDSAAGHRSPH